MKVKNSLLALALLPLAVTLNAADDASAKSANPAPAAAPASENASKDAFETIEQNGQKFIHISTISQVSACEEFMKNVQILQTQRQALVALNQILSPEEKKALESNLKTREEALLKNNEAMTKAYGFDISRDYIQQIVSTKIFVKLTDEEYKKAKEDEKAEFLVKGDDKYQLVAKIPTVEENDNFRRNVQIMQAARERLVHMNSAIQNMPDGEDKTKAQEQFKTEEDKLKENNDLMIKNYGFSLTRNYMVQIEQLKLFMKVNEEEYLKAEAQARLQSADKGDASVPALDTKPAEKPAAKADAKPAEKAPAKKSSKK